MRHLAGGLVLMAIVCSARAEQPEAPTAEQIAERMMAKNSERQAEVQSWSSEREYRVEYRGVGGAHEGEIEVRAEYVGGRKHLRVERESGSKMICEQVLRKMVESEQ